MDKKERFFQRLQDRTNINNTTNTIDVNNILTTSKIVPSGSDQKEVASSSSSLGLASRKPLGGGASPQVVLPPAWFGVKLDLFSNDDKLKLKIGVMLLKDKSHVELVAALNSPSRLLYRGTEEFDQDSHWNSVRSYEKFLKNQKIDYRCSKLIQPGKRGSINNMACFVWLDTHWTVSIIRQSDVYTYSLTDNLTSAFQKANGIATVYVGRTSHTAHKGIDCEELGL